MDALPNSRSALERWLALVVRYWCANMTMVHNQGSNWPGFGYTDDEKAEMQSIAEKFSKTEFSVWVGIVAVVFIALSGAVVAGGFACLTYATGGPQNAANTPEMLFFFTFGLILVVCFSIGFPAAMLPSSALAGMLFSVKDADLPDKATTAHYFHKLWFQITRMSLVMLGLMLPVWLFVPSDSKFWVTARLIGPLLSPVVGVLTTVYYFSAKLQRTTPRQ